MESLHSDSFGMEAFSFYYDAKFITFQIIPFMLPQPPEMILCNIDKK
jgi:hypothetical protein